MWFQLWRESSKMTSLASLSRKGSFTFLLIRYRVGPTEVCLSFCPFRVSIMFHHFTHGVIGGFFLYWLFWSSVQIRQIGNTGSAAKRHGWLLMESILRFAYLNLFMLWIADWPQ